MIGVVPVIAVSVVFVQEAKLYVPACENYILYSAGIDHRRTSMCDTARLAGGLYNRPVCAGGCNYVAHPMSLGGIAVRIICIKAPGWCGRIFCGRRRRRAQRS